LLVNFRSPSVSDGSTLEKGFQTPPDAAKPRVWWHWMNGNVTKKGIREDLNWMHRVGIGGFQNFDAGLNTPQVVEKRLIYMTPEWKDAFRFTTNLADSLGLEMAIAGSPGWSESGGPWVKPQEAMKKFVWSEIRVEGGKPFAGKLPQPPAVAGPFLNINTESGFMGEQQVNAPDFYADAAVVAFRIPENDVSMRELQPKITSSAGSFKLADLIDGDVKTSTFLPGTAGQKSWIQFEFAKPETMRALTIVGGGAQIMMGPDGDSRLIEASDDGVSFRKVTDIASGSLAEKTLSFAPTTAKYFRFVWNIPEPRPMPSFSGLPSMSNAPQRPVGTQVAELVLYTNTRVNRFEEKAAFDAASDLYTTPTPEVSAKEVIKKSEVLDLTSKMGVDGTLSWTPPAGKWAIIRLGYSLTGHKNGPASPEATGLEVDKLSAKHVSAYFTNYLDQYKNATGGLMGKHGLQYIITDSWEAGTQNWTDDMLKEFKSRRGYNMLSMIPALTGRVVESADASERFLWDFRKTLADLVAENHYDLLTKMLKERGMGRYSESHEARRAFIGDGMEAKRTADVPMGAGWTPGGFGGNEGGFATVYQADIRESASVAHLYGQNLVAAESLTAMGTDWAWSPELLKPVADHLMACGLNRFVIHTSVHQPVDDKIPGMSLGPFGQWFTRHETWAEQAKAWTAYLSRSCYMLQQGKFVADVAYYYGEDNNITVMFSKMRGGDLPPVPEGYSYDFINADALVNLLTVKDGGLVTPSGMSYQILALDPNSQYMTLSVLRKIKKLVSDGAIITGLKPIKTPSLVDNTAEFDALVKELWGNENGVNSVGKGKVYANTPLLQVFANQNIVADFTYTKPQSDSKLFFVHRRVDGTDIYWVNNRTDRVEDLTGTFRTSGKEAEIWHPEAGKIDQASFTIEKDMTKVPLHLEPNDAVFVVFRNKTSETSRVVNKPTETKLAEVSGPWNVCFQAKRGAPAQVTFETLAPWNENADQGIKYFSGTGTYTKTIQSSADWLKAGVEVWIDLGKVQNLAEVVLNGQSMGIVWKTPFRVNLTGALKHGENTLEIKVTNLWVNRLIGDRQPDAKEKITYTITSPYKADTPLKPSGLMGPVQLLSLTK
jgi:hypothetical protein